MTAPLPILIYGAGCFGREVAWLAERCRDPSYRVVAFLSDSAKRGQLVRGRPVLTPSDARDRWPNAAVALGEGDGRLRERFAERCDALGLRLATLVHPNVEMDCGSIRVGEGTVICAGNILTVDVTLGRCVQINLGCTVGHDAILEDFVTLAPGVHVSGWVTIKGGAYIGTGAVTVNGAEGGPLVIGERAVVGAGAVVTKDVPPGEMWVGVPARLVNRHALMAPKVCHVPGVPAATHTHSTNPPAAASSLSTVSPRLHVPDVGATRRLGSVPVRNAPPPKVGSSE